jgi:hypothetical protein
VRSERENPVRSDGRLESLLKWLGSLFREDWTPWTVSLLALIRPRRSRETSMPLIRLMVSLRHSVGSSKQFRFASAESLSMSIPPQRTLGKNLVDLCQALSDIPSGLEGWRIPLELCFPLSASIHQVSWQQKRLLICGAFVSSLFLKGDCARPRLGS